MLRRRAALWTLLASKLIAGWGVQWDIQWHVLIGRDSFWIPPHVMTYAGVALAVVVSFGVLAWETLIGPEPTPGSPPVLRVLGLTGTRGFHLAAWGIALTVLAAPIDDLWHRLFGLDVTLWSPPHLLGIVGAVVNSFACLVIAREVYPERSRARLVALVLTGAVLYGGLHLTVDPSTRVAYLQGGVLFYTLAILSALILPLAHVPTARLSNSRWAPLALLVVLIGLGLIGQQIAHTGFAIMQPVSVIDEEILKDPTSPIAVATLMARKEGVPAGQTGGRRHLFALWPALAMALVDARRRPVAATLAYAAALFAMLAWRLPSRPSLAAMAPTAPETLVALLLTLAAALLAGYTARWLSNTLERGQVLNYDISSAVMRSREKVPV
ncbi:MAG TPA: hypothetical protein VKJ67_10480 [Methylomirabilota bacterium]|nr:hypothetical protein [Methylomirabilota bacterium]